MPEPVDVQVSSEEPQIISENAENSADPEVLFSKGKRHLLCGETQKAVNLLQEASRLQAQKHGEMADVCAESYYLYGVALLELSRMESGVLGNALQGITTQEAGEEDEEELAEDKEFTEPDNYTEEEKEKISEEIIDAMLEPSEKPADDAEKPAEEPSSSESSSEQKEKPASASENSAEETCEPVKVDEEKGEASAEKTETTEEAASADKTEDESASKSGDNCEEESENTTEANEEGAEPMEDETTGADDEAEEEEIEGEETADRTTNEEEEDVSNLQVAWEMLELAKNIYKKHESAEMKLKQADCLLKLGEIGIESEQYKQAVDDIKECLELQTSAGVSCTDRRLAESHYQLGLAYSHSMQYSDALASYRKALDILQSRVKELTESSKGLKNEDAKQETERAAEKSAEEKSTGEEGKGIPSEVEELRQMEDELKELNALIPEIMNKIEDAEEDARNAGKVKSLIAEGDTASADQSSPFTEAQKEDKPVTNVSHLVRRKRKPEEDEDSTELANSEEAKKAKTSESEDAGVAATSEATVAAAGNSDVDVAMEAAASEPASTAEETPVAAAAEAADAAMETTSEAAASTTAEGPVASETPAEATAAAADSGAGDSEMTSAEDKQPEAEVASSGDDTAATSSNEMESSEKPVAESNEDLAAKATTDAAEPDSAETATVPVEAAAAE